MRHPRSSWETWARRGTGTFSHFEQAWIWLDQIDKDYSPCYLPIDLPDRDYYLRRMSEYLGVELKTNWTPKNETKERPRVRERDLSKVMALDVVRRFYEA